MSTPWPKQITCLGVHKFDAPYSPAIVTENTLLISGTVAVDANGELVGEGDLVAQTRQVLMNIGLLLASVGSEFRDVVRLNYYLTDISLWKVAGEVRREFLAEPFPAGTAVEVARLVDPRWLIEIEGVAILRTSEQAQERSGG